ncbi:MAG: hypothetical protein HY360_01705 [Verrucomicrobia bacterium]|nr:hypothetical protein [Verrucomicrobiota bacterium]
MKLLLTSLQTQNPLKPQDAGAMLGQMSQIGMIQSMTTMQQDIAKSRVEQQLTLGQSLINKIVRLVDSNNTEITGNVTEVQQNNGKVELRVNGQNYSITGLKAVLQ